ncbi:hypothetical protein CR513_10260, partial [Mucuna pruriens]
MEIHLPLVIQRAIVMIPMLKGICLRCHALGNLCFVIINGSGCMNVASERLVSKLALPTIIHPRSYRL